MTIRLRILQPDSPQPGVEVVKSYVHIFKVAAHGVELERLANVTVGHFVQHNFLNAPDFLVSSVTIGQRQDDVVAGNAHKISLNYMKSDKNSVLLFIG